MIGAIQHFVKPLDDLAPEADDIVVGRAWAFTLAFSRQYIPNNQENTRYTLIYWYGNRNKGETLRGNEIFSIDLLDSNKNIVAANVVGAPLPAAIQMPV